MAHGDCGGAEGASKPPDLGGLLVNNLAYVRAFLRLQLGAEFRARESVSDLVQSVCREILANPDRFEYRGEKAFRCWLCNAARMKLGEKKRFHMVAMRDVRREHREAEEQRISTIVAGDLPGPCTEAMLAEQQARIEQVFDLLSPQQRDVLTRSRVLGMTHAEIAGDLGLSEANCRKVLSRGRAAFAVKWHELGYDA